MSIHDIHFVAKTSCELSFLLYDNYCSGGASLVAFSESQTESERHSVELSQKKSKKKVVVLGTGWAGTSFIKDLDISSYDVQVVSPCNYFAFTPLLPSVTCGTVEARSIVEPIRKMIKKKSGEINFWEADCLKIDAANKRVFCRSNLDANVVGSNEFSLEYDYLVIAVGAQVNTFNTPGVLEYCILPFSEELIRFPHLGNRKYDQNFLKRFWKYTATFMQEVEDAQRIRRTVIDCFEKAVLPGLSEEERQTNLHFIIVGGGPTGVEFAAELHDFVQEDLVKIYPSVKDLVKITVIQSGDHILNTFIKKSPFNCLKILRLQTHRSIKSSSPVLFGLPPQIYCCDI
ncbi:NAD(P)H dehydrogenase B1 [Actinidia rufa]|uniref:NAD(P)H dehydrogenase B1 n=1 Tax=Actinidia rufa TaxID=165716 RepID=A0A7J0G483_9ERIC|nr:NAD(P)H dehydrogenase B1 [Actinidia rufa]